MEFLDERFSSTLRYNDVYLTNTSNIIQCSFLLHKSITYLDLNLCEYARYRRLLRLSLGGHPYLTWQRFINTEESCRKVLVPERKLLYSLHLDIPHGKEHNLRNSIIPFDYDYYSKSIHVVVRTESRHFNWLFFSIFEYAFKNCPDKIKLIRWLLDFSPPDLGNIPCKILNYFSTELHLKCTDSDFVYKCLKKFHLIGFLCRQEQPKILEYLLYHANRSAYITENCPYAKPSFIDPSISYFYLLNIEPYLKYMHEASFTTKAYSHFKRFLYIRKRSLTLDVLEKREEWISIHRNFRLLQLFMLFYHHYNDLLVPPKVIRLIWSSIPDPYITSEEITNAYGGVLSESEISEIYDFYTKAIGETPKEIKPRSLLQYSRTAIRRIIYQNKHWLPDAICQLCVPACLRSYLNLDMQIYRYAHLVDTDGSSPE